MPEIHSLTGNNILTLDEGPLFEHDDFITLTFVCEIEVDYKTASNVAASHGAAKALRFLKNTYGKASDLFTKAKNVYLGEISAHP